MVPEMEGSKFSQAARGRQSVVISDHADFANNAKRRTRRTKVATKKGLLNCTGKPRQYQTTSATRLASPALTAYNY
jgi:hypothetical protein